MSGGKQVSARKRYARPLASGLLGGVLISIGAGGASGVRADDSFAGAKAEKSAVADAPSENEDVAFATDQSDHSPLEPTVISSDNEPTVEDPPVDPSPSASDALADEYVTDIAPGSAQEVAATDDEPVAEDVGIDDDVLPAGKVTIAPIEVASFNGATPGVTTRAELLRDWGQPVDQPNPKSMTYALPGFAGVTVRFEGDRVDSLRIELASPASADDLIAKLNLDGVRPAEVFDESGTPLSTVFPERGVTFIHRVSDAAAATSGDVSPTAVAADQAVEVLVIRPIQAAPFLRRAENGESRAYACRIADLETALRLEGKNASTHWLLSQAKLATGSAAAAELLAHEAVDLDPRNDEYRLQWIKCLKYLARYDQAVTQTRMVLEGKTATPIVRAQAMEQMALLAALGSKDVQERAVPLHNKAIAMADQLAADEDPAVRVAANQLLVDAHLAVAERIAIGDFKDKKEFVGQWISRASALSEQMIESGEADTSLRLQVALSALVAGAKLDPPIDPKPWIDEAEQAVAALPPNNEDELAQAELDWQLGLAYLYATEISHRRGEVDAALDYGAFADAKLGAAQESRKEMPDTAFVQGRLFFQIGAVHAVHRGDHVSACQWYDRAIEPLSKPVPMTALASPGQHADALVSMAVSYWETGDRDRAYELTGAGVELVEQGIAEGLLTDDALKVPRNNFLAMSRALGKIDESSTQVTKSSTTPDSAKQVVLKRTASPVKRQVARAPQPRPQVRTATRSNAPSGGAQRR